MVGLESIVGIFAVERCKPLDPRVVHPAQDSDLVSTARAEDLDHRKFALEVVHHAADELLKRWEALERERQMAPVPLGDARF